MVPRCSPRDRTRFFPCVTVVMSDPPVNKRPFVKRGKNRLRTLTTGARNYVTDAARRVANARKKAANAARKTVENAKKPRAKIPPTGPSPPGPSPPAPPAPSGSSLFRKAGLLAMATTKSKPIEENEKSSKNTGKPSFRNRLTRAAVERELTQYNIDIREYVSALKSGQEVDPIKSKQLLANYNTHKKRFQLNNQNVKFLRQIYTTRRRINQRDNKAAANAA